jgi:tight adherence protein C
MLMFLSAVLFILVFACSLWMGLRFWSRPEARLDRVLRWRPHERAAGQKRDWKGLFEKAGALLNPATRSNARLAQNLARAGFRASNAEAIYHGVRLISGILGCALLGGAATLLRADNGQTLGALLAGIFVGFQVPGQLLALKIRRHRKDIERGLPNALDLLTICVEAGLGLDQAIIQVSQELRRAYPAISEEFGMITLETRAGKRRADALRSMAQRTGVAEVRKLAAVLIQADRFGTSLADSLRSHAEHMRTQARQNAEEKAEKLSVKLVFPIFFFILPSLFVFTVGPVVVSLYRDLMPMMNSL